MEHSPAATCAPPLAFSAGRSTVAGAPAQLWPASWQLEQVALLTTLCTIDGGALPLMLPNMKLLNVPGAWQLSQAAVPIGT